MNDPRADLEKHAQDTEAELQRVTAEIAQLQSRGPGLLEDWKKAMPTRDDNDIRTLMREHESLTSRIEELDADAAVLRAMIEECRTILASAMIRKRTHAAPERSE